MSYVVKMPKLGLEMDSGTIVEWVVEEGGEVEEDATIAEIESEKTTAEIDARESGVLRYVGVEEGGSAPPGAALAIVAGPDEDISALKAEFDGSEPTDAGAETDEPSAEAGSDAGATTGAGSGSRAGGGGGSESVKASPRAKKRADELDVDLSTVEGSGPGGAITESDVEAAESAGSEDVKASPRAKKRADELGVTLAGVEGSGPGGAITEDDVETAAESGGGAATATGDAGPAVTEERPLSGMRRTIADRLGQSYRESVHVTIHRTMNAESALAAADAAEEQLGADVSLTDVLLKALSATLADHPEFNATFEEDTHRLHEDHNICVAVDVDEGLLAPVVRGVDSLSLSDLSDRRREVTRRVLDGDFSMEDLSGGTFTVSNLGVLGVESFDPVINPPQIAILGVNTLEERVVPDGSGGFTTRRMLPLDLSFDHRIVDGADAARFMATLSDYLDDPWPLLDGVEAVEAESEAVELPNAAATASVGSDLNGTVEAGSFEYDFDVTEEFGGGTAPTPVDLFVSSLAACLSSSIGVQADIRDVEMRNVTVNAEATPPEGSVESLSLTVTLDTDADEETLERIVRNGERICHVNELLREDLPVSLDWRRA